MNGTADLDISRILSSLYRRKALIVCAFLVVSLLTAYTAVILPNIYQSSSLVLVSPQKVPTSFVTSTVTRDLNERMQSIIQEILSRTQLEKIVREFDLYSAGKNTKEVMIFVDAKSVTANCYIYGITVPFLQGLRFAPVIVMFKDHYFFCVFACRIKI